MDENVYKHLAERLDALPNAFPSTEDGIELRLLAKLFTPEEADLAALRIILEQEPGTILARAVEEGFPVLEQRITAGSKP